VGGLLNYLHNLSINRRLFPIQQKVYLKIRKARRMMASEAHMPRSAADTLLSPVPASDAVKWGMLRPAGLFLPHTCLRLSKKYAEPWEFHTSLARSNK
jgi:hypothetical protein